MTPTDPQALAEQLAHLEGQIDGAMATVRVGVAVIGTLLALLIGSVGYSFNRLAVIVEAVRRRTHSLANYYNLVAGKLGLPMYEEKS